MEEFAHAGENVVRLVAHPFDVRMEIENVYLLGAFNAEPTGRATGCRALPRSSSGRGGSGLRVLCAMP